jgi:hypothetical protein
MLWKFLLIGFLCGTAVSIGNHYYLQWTIKKNEQRPPDEAMTAVINCYITRYFVNILALFLAYYFTGEMSDARSRRSEITRNAFAGSATVHDFGSCFLFFASAIAIFAAWTSSRQEYFSWLHLLREQNKPALHFSEQHKSYKKAVNSQRLHESKGNNERCS